MKLGKLGSKYESFSLVEMIITIGIMGMVMVIASITLTTLIKVSSVASNKARVKNETEFVLEYVRRNVRNSDPSDVYIYKTYDIRVYNPIDNILEDYDNKTFQPVDSNIVKNIYSTPLGETVVGNEIHFRPYGYTSWICIGYFSSKNDPSMGYILKTSAQNLWEDHESCFTTQAYQGGDYSKYITVLNSDYVDVETFNIAYTKSSNANYIIRFDLSAQPLQWFLGSEQLFKKKVFRQAVVSTEGIVW